MHANGVDNQSVAFPVTDGMTGFIDVELGLVGMCAAIGVNAPDLAILKDHRDASGGEQELELHAMVHQRRHAAGQTVMQRASRRSAFALQGGGTERRVLGSERYGAAG